MDFTRRPAVTPPTAALARSTEGRFRQVAELVVLAILVLVLFVASALAVTGLDLRTQGVQRVNGSFSATESADYRSRLDLTVRPQRIDVRTTNTPAG